MKEKYLDKPIDTLRTYCKHGYKIATTRSYLVDDIKDNHIKTEAVYFALHHDYTELKKSSKTRYRTYYNIFNVGITPLLLSKSIGRMSMDELITLLC